MRQVLTHIRGGQNRKLLDDAVTTSPGKTQPFLVKGMEACVRVRWSRAKPFSSRLPLRPSVRLPRSPPARSLARGNSKLSPFTHSLAHSPNAGPASRARAGTPRPHLSLSPSLSPPSISVISKSAVLAARRARARSGDAVWKVISVLGPPSLPPSLFLFLTLTEISRPRSTVKSQISNGFNAGFGIVVDIPFQAHDRVTNEGILHHFNSSVGTWTELSAQNLSPGNAGILRYRVASPPT